MEPTTANGPTLDLRLGANRGTAVEFEHDLHFLERHGTIRILAFENQERAGSYREALLAARPGLAPELDPTRRNGARKYGFGLNFEQALSADAGVFGRYGWSDGKTESWAFTEIDRSLSGGLSLHGRLWHRNRDIIGLGVARNYLSGDHRSYLAAGGLGFIIGDGRLNYRPEQIAEAYYAFQVNKQWTVTVDYQHIATLADNRDRGPVSVASLRLHWEL
jgi:carbohydrate-selective porin OprB